jgi:hypothetical protein
MFEDLDLNAIHEENARELIERLLNMVEQLSGDLRAKSVPCRTGIPLHVAQ